VPRGWSLCEAALQLMQRWLGGRGTGSPYTGRLIAKKQGFGKVAKLTPFPIHEAEVRMTKASFCSRVRESMCVLLPKASELAVA
jgi:hypothetical protein